MIGQPYRLFRVAMLAVLIRPDNRAEYVTLDLLEGTLDEALDHLQADGATVHIVATDDYRGDE